MFNFWGLTIHLYGLLLGIGVWVGLEIAIWSNSKLKIEIEKAFLWALVGGVIGARFYHVVDYYERYYQYNQLKIFAVWEGGLGIWGAIVGGFCGLYIYCKIKNEKMLPILNAYAIGIPVAQAIGRLGNFVNGELYGKNGEPLFAYEALLNLILFIFLWKMSKIKSYQKVIFALYLIGYGLVRILLEGLRPNEIIWRISGIPTAIIFGAIAIAVGTILVWMDIVKKKQ